MQLFRNNREGTFEDVSRTLSNIPAESRRGAAFGDINNDGNVDVVLANVGAPPKLLLNQSRNSNHRMLFKLIGTKSNKMAIGARVTVKAGNWSNSANSEPEAVIFPQTTPACISDQRINPD
jgi:enediyne biosynthesis protein E4